jgi:hypothetical protein
MKPKQQFCSDLDESSLMQRFKDQILTLSIIGGQDAIDESLTKMRENLFNYIFKIFSKLQHLNFFYHDTPFITPHISFTNQPSVFSSTLVELRIRTYFFEHCLYLLNGQFDQLRTLMVNTVHIWPLQWTQINRVSQTNKESSSTDDGLSIARIN